MGRTGEEIEETVPRRPPRSFRKTEGVYICRTLESKLILLENVEDERRLLRMEP
jgi:hypothetical protein